MTPFITTYLPYILGGLVVLIAAVAAGVLLIVRSSQKKNPAAMFSAAMKQKAVLEKQYEKYEKQAGSAREKAGAAAESMRPPVPPIPPKPSLWRGFLAFFGIHSGNLSQSFKQSMKAAALQDSRARLSISGALVHHDRGVGLRKNHTAG